ncbi:MAG: hypothetical protein F4Y80_09040 [Caldilineaceae bacterium SB0665_bin_21]|nr:hypothetical protein [Caldilineaceae bacterium SB0665_bin_21]
MLVNPEEAIRVLLVEGQDDKHTVWQLCRVHPAWFSVTRKIHDLSVILQSNSQAFAIKEMGNQSDLITAIPVEVQVPDRQVLGIVLDTDQDLKECWAKVKEGFLQAGITLPTDPDPSGTIVPEQNFQPRIGIWLMPDNRSHGELENFALSMVPCHDLVWPSSQDYVDNIPDHNRKFEPGKTEKAKFYAWLATRKEPARTGAAIGSGDLEINGALCREFVMWLVKLFG